MTIGKCGVPYYTSSTGYVYYKVSKDVLTKEEFVEYMNNQSHEKNNYEPKMHSWLNWEEYVERRWEERKADDCEVLLTSYEKTKDTEFDVMKRIKERAPNFIEFCDKLGRPLCMKITSDGVEKASNKLRIVYGREGFLVKLGKILRGWSLYG